MISFDDVEKKITETASSGIRPGLARIERLLALLGNPQGKFPAVHVVGTNGKGSTCAYLASVFQEAGYRTALYTSPHLESPGERLLIDGRPLPPGRWMSCAERAAKAVAGDASLAADAPSYFELVTAAAFLLAEEERAEIAIVEAGLGGRLDATNLLSNVICTAVASISMDHTEYLGGTLAEIAGEKFAVVRPEVPACYMGDAEELLPFFAEFCSRAGAKPFVVSKEACLNPVSMTDEGCVFDFSAPGFEFRQIRTKLIGRYQLSNAALALSVLSQIAGRFERLTEEAVRAGMLNTRWPCRLEIFSRHLDGRKVLVVLDGGHNADGVTKLAESAAEFWGGKKTGLVYGVMRDKDYPACLKILNGLGAAFYATGSPDIERALSARDVADAARGLKWRWEVASFDNPMDALAAASKENDVVLVCGSLHLAGWVRTRLNAGV